MPNPLAETLTIGQTTYDIRDKSAIQNPGNGSANKMLTYTVNGPQWNPIPSDGMYYSTTEQVIGTWIDGNPLYQRTFTGQYPNAFNTWATLATIGETIFPVKMFGTLTNIDGKYLTMPNVNLDLCIEGQDLKAYGRDASNAGRDYWVSVLYCKISAN